MFDYKFKRSFSMWKKVQGVKEVWWEKLYQKNICHKDEWKNESCMSIKLLLFLSRSKLLYPDSLRASAWKLAMKLIFPRELTFLNVSGG